MHRRRIERNICSLPALCIWLPPSLPPAKQASNNVLLPYLSLTLLSPCVQQVDACRHGRGGIGAKYGAVGVYFFQSFFCSIMYDVLYRDKVYQINLKSCRFDLLTFYFQRNDVLQNLSFFSAWEKYQIFSFYICKNIYFPSNSVYRRDHLFRGQGQQPTLIKNKIKFSSYIRKLRSQHLQIHI